MIGQVIGNFRIVSVLGRGGMGEVFVGEHVGIQTRVAIKVLLPEISRHADHVERLFNEARIVARIKHAGIARIFDVGFHGGQAYLVMELLEGESLATRLRRCGAFPPAVVLDLGRQIASVLASTHGIGVTHRDLKPDNIFLVRDDELVTGERVKILDFGIAKLAGGSGPRTFGTMGTPEYMAPEQWGNSANVDWRADAYSLGCVLFEMATGRPPFPSQTIAEAYTQHTQAAPPSPRALAPDLPPALERLILALLAKDPAARGDSMTAIVRELGADTARATGSVGHLGAAPDLRTPRAPTTLGGGAGELVARTASSPRRTRGAAAAALVVALATGGVIAVVRRPAMGSDPITGQAGHAASSGPVATPAPNSGTNPSPDSGPARPVMGSDPITGQTGHAAGSASAVETPVPSAGPKPSSSDPARPAMGSDPITGRPVGRTTAAPDTANRGATNTAPASPVARTTASPDVANRGATNATRAAEGERSSTGPASTGGGTERRASVRGGTPSSPPSGAISPARATASPTGSPPPRAPSSPAPAKPDAPAKPEAPAKPTTDRELEGRT